MILRRSVGGLLTADNTLQNYKKEFIFLHEKYTLFKGKICFFYTMIVFVINFSFDKREDATLTPFMLSTPRAFCYTSETRCNNLTKRMLIHVHGNVVNILTDVTTLRKGCSYMMRLSFLKTNSDVTTLRKGCSYM